MPSEGVCHLFGAPLDDLDASPDASDAEADAAPLVPSGPACNTPLRASRWNDRATFQVEIDPASGKKLLRVAVGELTTLVPLDDDVVGLAGPDDGAAGCCEDACCAELELDVSVPTPSPTPAP